MRPLQQVSARASEAGGGAHPHVGRARHVPAADVVVEARASGVAAAVRINAVRAEEEREVLDPRDVPRADGAVGRRRGGGVGAPLVASRDVGLGAEVIGDSPPGRGGSLVPP